MQRAVQRIGACRGPLVVAGSALVVLFALGVGSCQTSSPRMGPSRALPSAVPLKQEPEVRVRLRQGVESVKIEGAGQVMVRSLAGVVEARRLPLPLTVVVLEGGVRVVDGREAPWRYPGGVEVVQEAGELLKVDATRHAGRLRVMVRDGVREGGREGGNAEARRLDLIEVVPMETYIAGVTVSELLRGWSLGAFHVQSICARTYALQQQQRAQGMGRDFDLESTVTDQAYHGWTDHAVATQAAAETRGMALLWQGRLLRAYYSSTCGGRTAGAAEIWPTGSGFEFNLDAPIQATEREHTCQDSTSYRWEVTRTVPELTMRMRRWGEDNGHRIKGMSGFASAAVIEVNSTGRPVKYEVFDIQGRRYELGAEHLRNACNFGVASQPEITMKNRVRSGDAELRLKDGVVTIRGRGFGHGVGMCQFCAQGFAKRGDSWREMVARFYPGVRVERMY